MRMRLQFLGDGNRLLGTWHGNLGTQQLAIGEMRPAPALAFVAAAGRHRPPQRHIGASGQNLDLRQRRHMRQGATAMP